MKIFLLEDDDLLFDIIQEFLLEREDEVMAIKDGLEAEEILLREKFDLLLLDVQVPSINGFELLKSLRSLKINTPAIFITSFNSAKDLKYGFEIGADDYIKKPFELDELGARIDNIKKHLYLSEEISLFDSLLFNPKNQTLKNTKDQSLNHLTQKESDLLLFFIKNKNKILSFEEIIINVWTYENAPNEATLRGYIKNLRRLLGFESITNIKGSGYRFNAV